MRYPQRAQVGGEPPPLLGGKAGIAAAAHKQRGDAPVGIGRRGRAHLGDKAVGRAEGVQRRQRHQQLLRRGGHQRPRRRARKAQRPAAPLHHQHRERSAPEAARRQRRLQPRPPALPIQRRSAGASASGRFSTAGRCGAAGACAAPGLCATGQRQCAAQRNRQRPAAGAARPAPPPVSSHAQTLANFPQVSRAAGLTRGN